ncbi:MAG: extracellular solute-binding protein [Janthinobacterium lividum]
MIPFFQKSVVYALAIVCSLYSAQATDPATHGISMHGNLKYASDFKNFSYVNPDAPKGGRIKFSVMGTFDTLNPFVLKGTPPPGLSFYSETLVFETLMRRSADEPFSLYGLIAESAAMAPDRSSITFNINPQAKWADGKSITADDVIFTYETLKEKGPANIQLFYGKVAKAEKLSDLSVKFTFKVQPDGKYDLEAPLLMALMTVMPKHFFDGKDFEKVVMTPIVGSGPYKVADVKPGHSIRYLRRPDHWARDLPINRGRFNFDEVFFEYYRNKQVEFEAFKIGHVDLAAESDPKVWARDFNFPAIQDGRILKIDYEHTRPVGLNGFVFNLRRDIFSDIRVRQALTYVFGSETRHRSSTHNTKVRTESYFANTYLANTGIPQGDELALFEPYRKDLPAELYQEPFHLPIAKDPTQSRDNLKKAIALLKEAGWHIRDGVLRHKDSNKPFEFEIILCKPSDEKKALAFMRSLKHVGIKAKIRMVDAAQFENRMGNFDFDMTIWFWGHTFSPGTEQQYYWGSAEADKPFSRNAIGIKSKTIDGLCRQVANAKDYETLKTSVHALDRALLWGYYTIPLFHHNKTFLAHWDKFGYPTIDPLVGIYFTNWWSKDESHQQK